MASTSTTTKSKLAPYKQALEAISRRTRTPLPSLVVSFAILHELTAIVPIAGFFFGARALGLGEGIIGRLVPTPSAASHSQVGDGWVEGKLRQWIAEGEVRAERVGKRYGWFGFEKGSKSDESTSSGEQLSLRVDSALNSGKLAGDVANFVAAYALTKALLPLRIGLSMYLAPPFSRAFVQPVGSAVSRIFRRKA